MIPDEVNFNSIKVRLKLIQDAKSQDIKIFQFHKGTIKTSVTRHREADGINFNSIKVRLKHYSIVPLTFEQYNFNSIKVRLKQNVLNSFLVIVLFQFHKGTIKTGFTPTRRKNTSISIP